MKARLGEKLRDKETKIQKLEEEIKGLNVKMDTKVSFDNTVICSCSILLNKTHLNR